MPTLHAATHIAVAQANAQTKLAKRKLSHRTNQNDRQISGTKKNTEAIVNEFCWCAIMNKKLWRMEVWEFFSGVMGLS